MRRVRRVGPLFPGPFVGRIERKGAHLIGDGCPSGGRGGGKLELYEARHFAAYFATVFSTAKLPN